MSKRKRIAVVVSQGQSANPVKRELEESIVTGLMFEPGIDVTVIPHLYDLKPEGTGLLALQGIAGDIIVCSWLFERAAHWVLDRNNVHGHVGTTLIQPEEDDDDFDDEELEDETAEEKDRVIQFRDIPNRKIYCLDLKVHESADAYIDEVKRIQSESSVEVVSLGGLSLGGVNLAPSGNGSEANGAEHNKAETNGALSNGDGANGSVANGKPANGVALPESEVPVAESNGEASADGSANVTRIEEKGGRRWYPVIDYSRCTNCMECIDFCLFGVYGVDGVETILVEQPDNCRKGCPACSRVCPENAIMFPQHKTPAIAGSADAATGLKIDLSKLFGAPDQGKDALEMAVLERDEQLQQAGRDTVGMTVGVPKRQADQESEPKDELDDLIDQLDELDL